jgi:hypothetical protein
MLPIRGRVGICCSGPALGAYKPLKTHLNERVDAFRVDLGPQRGRGDHTNKRPFADPRRRRRRTNGAAGFPTPCFLRHRRKIFTCGLRGGGPGRTRNGLQKRDGLRFGKQTRNLGNTRSCRSSERCQAKRVSRSADSSRNERFGIYCDGAHNYLAYCSSLTFSIHSTFLPLTTFVMAI